MTLKMAGNVPAIFCYPAKASCIESLYCGHPSIFIFEARIAVGHRGQNIFSAKYRFSVPG
jgi:hypothetical protein